MTPKYPQINIPLVGEDGNAFAILGRVRAAMKKAKVPPEEMTAFSNEAASGDYDHLLQTVMKWVGTDEEDKLDINEGEKTLNSLKNGVATNLQPLERKGD